ncbi:NADH-quinone oxidoreductase subunit NuoF [Desulfosporosinus burensis]
MTFEQIQLKAITEWGYLEDDEIPRIYINTSGCGRSSGALQVLEQFKVELEQSNINAKIVEVGCIGSCSLEPLIFIAKRGRPRLGYSKVTLEIVAQLVTDYLVNDNPRADLAIGKIGEGEIDGIPNFFDLPFFKNQVRIATRNCGIIDPGNIDHYIANDGYSGLAKVLKMTPEQVIEEVEKSGLRGRGGAGFPTATKWSSCNNAPGSEKYMICNAAEGDPGAYSVKMLLESDPHAVLEGMLIGAYAVGAAQGYIYINADNGLAIERLRKALQQTEEVGLLGNNILASGFSFQVEVYEGTGDFVGSVETAMIRTMEGKRTMSYTRPPYPDTSGLRGKPTCINSTETLANVSAIMQKGADWYAGFGTDNNKGSKLLTLTGKVLYPGVIEVPMGTTLRQIVHEIGGGITGNQDLKAMLIGGPTGGFLPASALYLPVDFDHLAAEGAIMGSGRIMVVDTDTCMVDLAKNCLSFTKAESCGKCVMCREGTAQLLAILTDITEGKGKSEDLDLLLELGEGMQSGSICGLGRTAPNPVLTAIKYFRDEFEAHIKRKRCPALVCKKYITYHILGDKCQGCQICLKNCPNDAIAGEEQMIHVIDQDECTKCGVCLEVCPSEYRAVTKAGGVKPKTPDEPIPVGSWRKR